MCTVNLYQVANVGKMSDACNQPCGGDEEQTCGGEKSTNAFFIKEHCEKGELPASPFNC